MQKLAIMFCVWAAVGLAFAAEGEKYTHKYLILLNSSGETTLEAQVYGDNDTFELAPGYRANFKTYLDILSLRGVYFTGLVGATTKIAKLPETPIKMDKVNYIVVPGFRMPFRKTMIQLSLFHECFHTISREEIAGSTWWNSIQIGGGTKGSYHNYMIEKYNRREFSLRNSFDANLTLGYYLHGEEPLIGSNHRYTADARSLVRYHVGLFRNLTVYFDSHNIFWLDKDNHVTFKSVLEANWVILGTKNIGTLFLKYALKDDNPYDNEENLLSLGFKLIY